MTSRLSRTASGGSLASDNAMRFSSKPVMGSSGLYYYGYRFYDPTSQRWLNRDPIEEEGGCNLYGFVHSRPIDSVDLDGLVNFPRIPTIPSFPWPNPLPRPTRPPIAWPRFPTINFPEDPISCANRIKNDVWNKFGWDEQGNPRLGHRSGDTNFHYGHCVAHCRIQRECLGGRCTSWAGGLAKEIWDEIKQQAGSGGAGYDAGDMDANREGRNRGRHMKHLSCEDACKGMEG